MSKGTALALNLELHYPNLHYIDESTQAIGRWLVSSFRTEHDALGSLGFYIKHMDSEENIMYITDTGYCKFNPIGLTTLIVECNYLNSLLQKDTDKLQEEGGRYLRTYAYHMSLERLLSYLSKIDRSELRDIVLVHLSDRYSDEEVMIAEVKRLTAASVYAAHAGDTISLDAVPF